MSLPSEYYQVAYVDIGQVVDKLTAMFGAMDESQAGRRRCRDARPSHGQPGEHPPWRQFLPTRRDGRIERDPLHRGASVLT